jgi:AraC-like DNA-binding protein
MRRIVLGSTILAEHASEDIVAARTAAQCRQDHADEICVDAMAACSSAWMSQQGQQQRVVRGSLCVLDFGRPLEVRRSRHLAAGVVLPRQCVREVIGEKVDELGGRRLASSAIGTLLQSHLRVTLDQAARLSPQQRAVATIAARELALAVLQAEVLGVVDPDWFPDGLYQAARRLISDSCHDPELTPTELARRLQCSRASLYRAFARQGDSVAAAIWSARLTKAWAMLTVEGQAEAQVSEIAFVAGFVEQSSFNRMFRKRFGMTPREARASRQECLAS